MYPTESVKEEPLHLTSNPRDTYMHSNYMNRPVHQQESILSTKQKHMHLQHLSSIGRYTGTGINSLMMSPVKRKPTKSFVPKRPKTDNKNLMKPFYDMHKRGYIGKSKPCLRSLHLNNGYIKYIRRQGQIYRAEHFCNKGFKRIGLKERRCSHSGNWQGARPTCSG